MIKEKIILFIKKHYEILHEKWYEKGLALYDYVIETLKTWEFFRWLLPEMYAYWHLIVGSILWVLIVYLSTIRINRIRYKQTHGSMAGYPYPKYGLHAFVSLFPKKMQKYLVWIEWIPAILGYAYILLIVFLLIVDIYDL